MKTLTFDQFSIDIFDNWVYQEENGIITIYDNENGKGPLQISCYSIAEFKNKDLYEMLKEYLFDHFQISENSEIYHNILRKDNQISLDFDDEAGGYWYLTLKTLAKAIAFVTYNCAVENKTNEELESVHTIINSIV